VIVFGRLCASYTLSFYYVLLAVYLQYIINFWWYKILINLTEQFIILIFLMNGYNHRAGEDLPSKPFREPICYLFPSEIYAIQYWCTLFAILDPIRNYIYFMLYFFCRYMHNPHGYMWGKIIITSKFGSLITVLLGEIGYLIVQKIEFTFLPHLLYMVYFSFYSFIVHWCKGILGSRFNISSKEILLSFLVWLIYDMSNSCVRV